MIEITFTDIVLLAWGMIATGYAFKYRHDARMSSMMMWKLAENPDLYAQMRSGWLIAKQVRETTRET